jgi:hypothetical protein
MPMNAAAALGLVRGLAPVRRREHFGRQVLGQGSAHAPRNEAVHRSEVLPEHGLEVLGCAPCSSRPGTGDILAFCGGPSYNARNCRLRRQDPRSDSRWSYPLAIHRKVTGQLRVGFTSTTQGVALTRLVDAFEANNHGCHVLLREVDLDGPYAALRRSELDVLVNWLAVDEPDLAAGPAIEYRERVLAVSSSCFARRTICSSR